MYTYIYIYIRCVCVCRSAASGKRGPQMASTKITGCRRWIPFELCSP